MQTVAQVLVERFISYGVEYIFCVPGASIDNLLNELQDKEFPKLILCHHESTAGYMATAYGKITGKPAIVMVTAGPGATNVASAVATAQAENTPLIAISGQMDSRTTFKPSHQVINSQALFEPITKWSVEITNTETAGSAFDIAYQTTITGQAGAVHLAIASDRLKTSVTTSSTLKKLPKKAHSFANPLCVKEATAILSQAKKPLVIVGGGAATVKTSLAIQALIKQTKIPLISTFEGAGTVSQDLEQYFMGRLGVFQNQPCNQLIQNADVILSIGYNIAELDPLTWNKENNNTIIHVHQYEAEIDKGYQPEWQLIGEIDATIDSITKQMVMPIQDPMYVQAQNDIRYALVTRLEDYVIKPHKVHPLHIIKTLKALLSDENTVVTDVGSHQYWMSEHYYTYHPRYFLSSMGFQTMGVSLPFAIAATLVRKEHKVISVSGDGSFLMCSMELATAVKLQLPIIHLVWKDHSFNLVEVQEIKKYKRSSGAVFESNIDFAQLAESFGATGFTVTESDQLLPTLEKAMTCKGPVVIDITVDYSDNLKLVS
jgi:acetolactate synthase I/II/III large subunit